MSEKFPSSKEQPEEISKMETYEILSKKEQVSSDFEVIEGKIEKDVENLPEEAKEKVEVGLHNLGFYVEEKKNNFFAKTFEWAAEKTELDEKGTTGRFVSSLVENFKRDADKARERMIEIEETGKKHQIISTTSLIGNILRFGRIVTDIVGATATAPFRYVMAGSMLFSRGSEAAKEARFKNEEVIDKTRIADADRAAEEAWKIYGEAKEKNGGEISAKDLNKAYQENLPEDIMNRLKEKAADQPALANRMVQNVLKFQIEQSVGNLENKIKEIEGNEKLNPDEKQTQKDKLFKKYERRLTDYDRALSQYGTVDALAMGTRYAELGGKAVVGAMTVQSAILFVERLPDIIPNALKSIVELISSGNVAYAAEISPADFSNLKMDDELKEKVLETLIGKHEKAGIIKNIVENNSAGTTIMKGGNAWEAARSLKLADKDFWAAWGNPESMVQTPHGLVHISEAGLTHEGNMLKYIPGEGGKSAHFELVEGKGGKIGSNEDLLNRYRELGKKPPAWLEKTVPNEEVVPIKSTIDSKPSLRAQAEKMIRNIEPENYSGTAEHIVTETENSLNSEMESIKQNNLDIKEILTNFKTVKLADQEKYIGDYEAARQKISDDISEMLSNPDITGSKSSAEIGKIWGELDEMGRNIGKLKDAHFDALQATENIPTEEVPIQKDLSINNLKEAISESLKGTETSIPETIKFRGDFMNGMDGHITLGFNANHEALPINYNEVVFSGSVKETDFAKDDWLKTMTEKGTATKNGKWDLGAHRAHFNDDLRDVKKLMLIHERLSENFGKHDSLVVKDIATKLNNIAKMYGDVLDMDKLPKIFRK